MDTRTRAAQSLVNAFRAVQNAQTKQAQAAKEIATQQTAQTQAAACYLQASGGADEEFVWGATGHVVTVKGGVVTVSPPQPVIVSIATPAATPTPASTPAPTPSPSATPATATPAATPPAAS